MRVALVSEFYYPHLGGITEHVHNLALQLSRLGHEVILVTSRMTGAGGDPPFVRRLGTSRVIYSNGSFARITTGFGLTTRLADLFQAERVDLVHVHGGLAPTFGLLAPLAANRVDVPVVATFHSWFPRSALCRIFRGPLQRILDRHAATIAVSQPAVDAMSRYFRADWEIIPNGVDTEVFNPAVRTRDSAARSEAGLLFLGRLDPRNGLETALRALPLILARRPDVRLTVVGDGPLRGYYEQLARTVAPSVRFIGAVNGERARYYADADLYLCPTTKASFGITLLEAMASGTPQVVSDVTGFRELIAGGDEAVLVPQGEPEAWAASVLALLEDPARRARMGTAGRAKALTYAWPSVAAQVLAVYRRVLG
jgi:phosphatidylinositol alpha-mannosyltransferase